jgi:hypothetical protein
MRNWTVILLILVALGGQQSFLPSSGNTQPSTTVPFEHLTVTDVHVIDSHGDNRSAFKQGENLSIVVTFNYLGDIPLNLPKFDLTIYDAQNTPVYVIRSEWLGTPWPTSLTGGQFTPMIFTSGFEPGVYRVEVTILSDWLAAGGHYISDGRAAVTFTVS